MNPFTFYPLVVGLSLTALFGITEPVTPPDGLPRTIPLVHTIIDVGQPGYIIIVDDIANYADNTTLDRISLPSDISNLTIELDRCSIIDSLRLSSESGSPLSPSPTCHPLQGEIELKIEQLNEGYLFVFSSNANVIHQYRTTTISCEGDCTNCKSKISLEKLDGSDLLCLKIAEGLTQIP